MEDSKMITYEFLEELNSFLFHASSAMYAGGGQEVITQHPGFTELEYPEGDWSYRDRYGGYDQSWGQEVVWHRRILVWTQLYGGGMAKLHHGNRQLADETFSFLKIALTENKDEKTFRPRGPWKFSDGIWKYEAKWSGNMVKFRGEETISKNGMPVFTHDFFGGLFIA